MSDENHLLTERDKQVLGETEADEEDTVEVSREEFQKLVERVDQLEEENQELRERNQTLRDNVTELEKEVQETQVQTARDRAKIKQRVTDLEEKIETGEIPDGSESESVLEVDEDASTIEKYATIPEEVRESSLSEIDRRATKLYENFEDWATKARGGKLVLTTQPSSELQSSIQDRLEAAFDERFASKTVHDTMKRVEELSEEIEFKDRGKRQPKILMKEVEKT